MEVYTYLPLFFNDNLPLIYIRVFILLCSASAPPTSTPAPSGARTSAAVAALSRGTDDSTIQTKLDLTPPKGTRDFYPEDKRLSNWLFDHFRRIGQNYGFEEYDAPVRIHMYTYIYTLVINH